MFRPLEGDGECYVVYYVPRQDRVRVSHARVSIYLYMELHSVTVLEYDNPFVTQREPQQ